MPTRRASLPAVAFLCLLAIRCVGPDFADVSKDSYVPSETCVSCHRRTHPGVVSAWRLSRHRTALRLLDRPRTLGIIGRRDGPHVLLRPDLRIVASPEWREEEPEDEPAPPHDVIATQPARVDAGRQCLGCHSTGYFASRRQFAEPGVGCQACHGPGRKHAASRGNKKHIVNPARLSRARSNMVCGQCHSVGRDLSGAHPFPTVRTPSGPGPFQPGGDLARAFVDARPKLVRKGWEYSLFAQADRRYARQLCTDCHDPHGRRGQAAMLKDPTNGICFRCHGLGRARLRYKNHWGLGDATKKPCWTCHQNTHDH